MLKKIRTTTAALSITALTLLFLDYTGTIHTYLGWCAKMQFAPARLAVNNAIVGIIIIMTLLLGRVYCSVICPLGIFQDVISRIAGIRKKDRFFYRPARKALFILRYGLLVIFLMAAALGVSVITALMEPYSAYGRMASQIFGPVYKYGNNILAHFAERAGSYAFYTVDVWMRGAGALAVAVLTFVVVGVFAWKSGRGYCNGICPVGAFLALFARSSVMKLRVDKGKCGSCGLCVKNCKAGCIDPSDMEIDYSRCVVCFNCKGSCPKKAVKYVMDVCGKKPVIAKVSPDIKTSPIIDNNLSSPNRTDEPCPPIVDGTNELFVDNPTRRSLMSGIAIFALGLITRTAARTYNYDGGLAPLEDKKATPSYVPIIPPGADSIMGFGKRCTACQLCVSVCPNQVLRPSSKFRLPNVFGCSCGICDPISVGFLQPHISYERGYCRPECVKCSQVCPTGAIRPITTAEKSSIQIGCADWIKDLCVVNTDKVICDLCARKCPTGAITMIPQSADDPSPLKIPMIDTSRCIGCGACEHLCPARPYSAIYVEGIISHRTI